MERTTEDQDLNRFKFHRLNDMGIDKSVRMQMLFEAIHGELKNIITESGDKRAWSIAQTKLEEASFFAKKAMALDPLNQENRSTRVKLEGSIG